MSLLSSTPNGETLIRAEQRKTLAFALLFRDLEDGPLDITGAQLSIVVRQPKYKGGAIVITSPAVIEDAEAGDAHVVLQADDLDLVAGEYPYTISILTEENYSAAVVKGTLEVVDNTEDAWVATTYSGVGVANALIVSLHNRNRITVKVSNLPRTLPPGFMNSLDHRFGRVVTPEMFGAAGDGVVDDSAEVQAAMDLASSLAVPLLLTKKYLVGTPLVAIGPLTVHSVREPNAAGAQLVWETAGAMFTTAYTTTWEDVSVVSYSGDGGTAVVLNGHQLTEFTNCSFSGMDIGIDSEDSVAVGVDRCTFAAIQTYGMLFRYADPADAGDHRITNCLFTGSGGATPGDSAAHIRIESSAGQRITGNKFLGCDRAIDVHSTKAAMSVLVIAGNSIEWNAVESIRVSGDGVTGTMAMVVISGNEIGTGAGGGSGTAGIRLSECYGVTVVGNTIVGPNTADTAAIVCEAAGVEISGNTLVQWDIGVDNSDGGALVGANALVLVNTPVKENLDIASLMMRPAVENHQRVRVNTTGVAPLDLFEIEPGEAASVRVVIEAMGSVFTVGTAGLRQEYEILATVGFAPTVELVEELGSGEDSDITAVVDGDVVRFTLGTTPQAYTGFIGVRATGSPCNITRLVDG
jgi:hypothetical protein